MAKQSNDSTQTVKGIIYQFLVALEKCFMLRAENESVFIETFGDISILKDKSIQIESKYYKGYLTDLDYNVWNTLNNWMKDGFPLQEFSSLVLLTTQKVRKNSSWYGWNTLKKEEKLFRFLKINTEYNSKKTKSKQTSDLLNSIFNDTKRERLINILDKFVIEQNAVDDKTYYQQIKNEYCKTIPDIRADQYMRTMFAYIISLDVIDKQWKISFNDFTRESKIVAQSLIDTTLTFPQKISLDNVKYDDFQNNSFVEKIKEIDYKEVIPQAVSDFAETRELILTEFKTSPFLIKKIGEYEEDIQRKHSLLYRRASRNASYNEDKIIPYSKDFYDDFMSLENINLHLYNSVPPYFYNGMVHILADEKDNVNWLLNPSTNE